MSTLPFSGLQFTTHATVWPHLWSFRNYETIFWSKWMVGMSLNGLSPQQGFKPLNSHKFSALTTRLSHFNCISNYSLMKQIVNCFKANQNWVILTDECDWLVNISNRCQATCLTDNQTYNLNWLSATYFTDYFAKENYYIKCLFKISENGKAIFFQVWMTVISFSDGWQENEKSLKKKNFLGRHIHWEKYEVFTFHWSKKQNMKHWKNIIVCFLWIWRNQMSSWDWNSFMDF